MKRNKEARGFTLIELLICVVILALIGVGFVAVFSRRAMSEEEKNRAAAAAAGAETALEVLSGLPKELLAGGGSFTVGDDRTINIRSACSPQNCDWLVIPGTNTDSIAKGFPFAPGAEPPFAKTVLLRRWLIEDVDANFGLKRITVVVAPDESSVAPLAVEKAVVGK